MRLEGDTVVLSTGVKFYANRGLLSVDEVGRLTEGYDGAVSVDEQFSAAERREIANFMIDVWREWAQHGQRPRRPR